MNRACTQALHVDMQGVKGWNGQQHNLHMYVRNYTQTTAYTYNRYVPTYTTIVCVLCTYIRTYVHKNKNKIFLYELSGF